MVTLYHALIEWLLTRLSRQREREAQREHELQKLELLMQTFLQMQDKQVEVLVAIGEACKSQADVITRYISLYTQQQQPQPQAAKPVAAVDPNASWLEQRRKLFDQTGDVEYLEGIAPELQIAWALAREHAQELFS